MKQKGWVLTLIILLAFCFAGWNALAQKQARAEKVWEYKITNWLSEEDMNKLGAQGWELTTSTFDSNNTFHYFKRAK
jgi:hypothetical protein